MKAKPKGMMMKPKETYSMMAAPKPSKAPAKKAKARKAK